MKNVKLKGTKAGIICFSVFMTPWLLSLILALITDIHGFRVESILGTLIGILVFAVVSAFLGFSIARKSVILIVFSSLLVVATPVCWVIMPWLP